jgi:glycosyltransferase involved in cell wall biosynthesis
MYEPDRAQFSVGAVDVTIVMPCLNEQQSLPHCVANAQEALRRIEADYGFTGEILIADNGSTDGSQALALSLGARVEPVPVRGYGAALIAGCHAARGRFILMGDCDGSYDFTDGVAMIGRLADGSALCMGSRFDGGIAPGAMPWKNRWIGNPALTGILNLFFRSGINDAHCGLRAIRKESFQRLRLSGTGMEFASEMVIKAALLKLPISQAPAKLLPDLRDRAPHLRPWRDGWRHLRYLLMLSPTWAFGIPGALALALGSIIMFVATASALGFIGGERFFGESWIVIAGFLLTMGHLSAIMALATHFHGVASGYRTMRPSIRLIRRHLKLEAALAGGLFSIIASIFTLLAVGDYWRASGFVALPSILPLVCGAALGVMGMQTILGGFLFAIIAGHKAEFGIELEDLSALRAQSAEAAAKSPILEMQP